MPPKKNFYAVREGRERGIFASWPECQRSVERFPGAKFQGFVTRAEAVDWLNAGGGGGGGGGGGNSGGGRGGGGAVFGGQFEHALPRQPPMQHATPYQQALPYQPLKYVNAFADSALSAQLAFAPSLAAAPASAAAAAPSMRAHPYQQHPTRSSPQRRHVHSSSSVRSYHNDNASLAASAAGAESSHDSMPPLERADSVSTAAADAHGSDAAATPAVKPEPYAAPAAPSSRLAAQAAAPSSAYAAASSSAAAASAAAAAAPAPAAPASAGPVFHAVLYCDGAAKANPVGDSGAGAVLYACAPSPDGSSEPVLGRWVASCKKYLGRRSNVEAEYESLLLGLQHALSHGVTHLTVRMDSELVVRHMAGEYAVRAQNLRPLYEAALSSAAKFQSISVQHVRRALNAEADQLANQAVQEGRMARLDRSGGFRY